MRKIIVVTVLVFIALLAVPLKKKYIPKKDSTYIKTNIKNRCTRFDYEQYERK